MQSIISSFAFRGNTYLKNQLHTYDNDSLIGPERMTSIQNLLSIDSFFLYVLYVFNALFLCVNHLFGIFGSMYSYAVVICIQKVFRKIAYTYGISLIT